MEKTHTKTRDNIDRLLRVLDLKATFGCSRATVYDWIKRGLIPPPVKISERMSVWPKHEIDTIIEARKAGHGNDLILVLVKKLVANRKTAFTGI